MEQILRIEKVNLKKDPNGWEIFEGYQILTNQQTIRIGISDVQCCCEDFGCIITNDDITDFLKSNLKSITIVDQALDHKKIDQLEYLDSGGAMFVNLETSQGLLQFVAYNSHNRYYGHDAVLISKQLNKEQVL